MSERKALAVSRAGTREPVGLLGDLLPARCLFPSGSGRQDVGKHVTWRWGVPWHCPEQPQERNLLVSQVAGTHHDGRALCIIYRLVKPTNPLLGSSWARL